jgi:hypothetical protein
MKKLTVKHIEPGINKDTQEYGIRNTAVAV